MSIHALNHVFKMRVPSSPLKFVLLCFANYANEYDTTYCSTERIQQMTDMSVNTIAKWVNQLEDLGYLVDTGKREGKTQRTKVYKIVLFEIHPKLGVLKEAVIPPEMGGLNTPKIENSPTPPNIDNLNSKPKLKNNKKSPKVTLEEWEAAVGSQLCVAMLASWIKDARADAEQIAALIIEFRDKMLAGGNVYADFRAAFRDWLRRGFLSKPMAQVQQQGAREAREGARVPDTRTSL